MVKKKSNTLLIIGIIALFLFMSGKIKLGSEAIVPVPEGSYLQFTTTNSQYSSGSIKLALECGGTLFNYNYYSSSATLSQACNILMGTTTYCPGSFSLIEEVPGGWLSGGTPPELWGTDLVDGNGNYRFICVCDSDGTSTQIKKYQLGGTTSYPSTYNDQTSLICTMGAPPPGQSCTDSDGENEFSQGTLVDSTAGTFTDTCETSDKLKEYYCNGNEMSFVYFMCSDFNKICQDGACVAQPFCTIPGDTPPACDGIDRAELGQAISKWIAGTMTRAELGQAIVSWLI